MLARINTIAFNGLNTLDVDLQLQISSGIPAFNIVGLPDKTIAESKERVRAALNTMGVELPAKRITINLAPADLLKEGSHFDLPIALALLAGMGIVPAEDVANYVDRIIVMDAGKPQFDGTPKEVFTHYKQLEAMGLAAPQVTYVMNDLKDAGMTVDASATTVEEAKNAILASLK